MKARLVIYALGKIFKEYKEKIPWSSVVALCDKNMQCKGVSSEYSLILPSELNNFEFDYIVIFSDKHFSQIREDLIGNYYIKEKKILSWNCLMLNQNQNLNKYDMLLDFISHYHINHMLDIHTEVLTANCYSKYKIRKYNENCCIDRIIKSQYPVYENLYDKIYENIALADRRYDLIIATDLNACIDCLQQINSDYLIFFLNPMEYLDDLNDIEKSIYNELSKKGNCRRYSTNAGLFYVLDHENSVNMESIAIYVVMHKKYNVKCDELYKPICVGDYRHEGYISEEKGDNIAQLSDGTLWEV